MSQDASGQVFCIDRVRAAQRYAKYRLPDRRQVQRRIGPAWTERAGPAHGYYTKRTAQAWLRDVVDRTHRGTIRGPVRAGATFADAAAEWLRYVEHDRARKPSTVAGHRALVR